MLSATAKLTYVTADIPGIGGQIKLRPEDFLVEEQPLYQPTGTGEHLYLFVEKTRMTSHDVVKRICRAFRCGKREIGMAGLKDKHAITRQHFSIHLPKRNEDAEQESLERLGKTPGLTVLWSERHENKLRRGHHAGNRFVLRIRNVQPTDVLRVRDVLAIIEQRGAANYFGRQRFGYRQNSHLLGRHLLLGEHEPFLEEMLGTDRPADTEYMTTCRAAYRSGDYQAALDVWPRSLRFDRQALDALRRGESAEQTVRRIDRNQRKFLISALQSAIFNDVLDQRVAAGNYDQLLPGDVAWKHANRACFTVDADEAAHENGPDGRIASFEISPSGPLWGREMLGASGAPAEMELRALRDRDLTLDQLRAADADLGADGVRRPLRVKMRDPDFSSGVDEHGPFVRVAFELPRGAFATAILREIMKNDGEEEPIHITDTDANLKRPDRGSAD